MRCMVTKSPQQTIDSTLKPMGTSGSLVDSTRFPTPDLLSDNLARGVENVITICRPLKIKDPGGRRKEGRTELLGKPYVRDPCAIHDNAIYRCFD